MLLKIAWCCVLVGVVTGIGQAFEDRRSPVTPSAIVAQSRIKGEQADVGRMIDDDPTTWWASGPGDLALDPVDVDVLLSQPCVADGVAIVTSTLKGQLRLRDFNVYAGLGESWDGAHPLAQVRENASMTIQVDFPPVRVDRLRLRLLGTCRPDNAFAHIAELKVLATERAPQQTVKSSPVPTSPAQVGHDPQALRSLIALLTDRAGDASVVRRRVQALEERLRLIEESREYELVLERISAETDQFRQLDAPEWALSQRDCMARLRNWVYYWIDHQQPDGQFGGSYEDDVELVCGWPVLVLAQDDSKVRDSLELLADGVWRSRPFLEQFGYDRLTDVEHAAENTSYSQPRMVLLESGNPKWSDRCRRTTRTMAEHFLSRNERGHLQFRSDYFGFDAKTHQPVTRQKERPFDIPESSKALKPAMYSVWATEDAESRKLMLDVGRTWVEAAKDAQGGDRIAGLLPEKILWPSGRAVGTHARISSMRATLFHLIGCYWVSKEDRYLQPIRDLLQKTVIDWSVNGIPSAGTLAEVRDEDHVGMLEQLALVAILYRRATGDTRFDAHLARWTQRVRDSLVDGAKSYVFVNRQSEGLWHVDRPLTVGAYRESRCGVGAQLYLGWLVTQDERFLTKLGANLSSCLTDKWGAFTYWFYDKSERRVTSNDHPAHKLQNSESALCLMFLGGPGPVEAVWPRLAVSWSGVGENFCALVRQNSPDSLSASLYCFDRSPRTITAHLWELMPGTYEAVWGPEGSGSERSKADTPPHVFQVEARKGLRHATLLRFELPAQTLTALEIRRR